MQKGKKKPPEPTLWCQMAETAGSLSGTTKVDWKADGVSKNFKTILNVLDRKSVV